MLMTYDIVVSGQCCYSHYYIQKAVKSATLMDTVLVGEDTDLLILLCYHASLNSHNIFF